MLETILALSVMLTVSVAGGTAYIRVDPPQRIGFDK